MRERLNPDDLDDEDPFEIEPAGNEPHLFAHNHYSTADLYDIYVSDPLFAEAREDGPADWLMIGEVPGEDPLVVPLMPPGAEIHARRGRSGSTRPPARTLLSTEHGEPNRQREGVTEMPNSGMSDKEAYAYYADPDNREAAGPGRRRRTRPMSSHVPVRFAPEVIAEVKQVAREDKKTVSSWIRDTVQHELERRRPRYPATRALPAEEHFTITGLGAHVSGTQTSVSQVLENA